MKKSVMSLCAVFAIGFLTTMAFPEVALAKRAQCQLTVDGVTYINGLCDFVRIGNDGSFQIFAIPNNGYFADVSVNGDGTAEGYWNEIPGTNHAHSRLGTLVRNDACWVNSRVIVCAK